MKTSKVILIIDDEFIILESLKIQLSRFLNEESHIVEFASCGEEAFAIIDEYHAKNVTIDLIITDYHLDDVKGTDIIYFMHEKFPLSKKYILTGESGNNINTDELKNIEIHGYISKPWEFEDFKDYVLKSIKD
jgi:response regulator RpfG family c-di-GMP phosphodiesterase